MNLCVYKRVPLNAEESRCAAPLLCGTLRLPEVLEAAPAAACTLEAACAATGVLLAPDVCEPLVVVVVVPSASVSV